MEDQPTNSSVTVQDLLPRFGLDAASVVCMDGGYPDHMDPYSQELMVAALKGRPVVATATSKNFGQIGKELLHAMACIPPGASCLTEFEAGRLEVAGAKINTLTIELVDLLRSSEEALATLTSLSQGGKRPLLGIDFRVRAGEPPFAPPDDVVKKLVLCAQERDVPVLVAMNSRACSWIWEELYGS